jgi:hypothetical protein
MENIYLLKRDKLLLGPYTIEMLKEKNIKPSDLLWYEGLADWVPAGTVFELEFSETSASLAEHKEKLSIKNYLKKVFSLNK